MCIFARMHFETEEEIEERLEKELEKIRQAEASAVDKLQQETLENEEKQRESEEKTQESDEAKVGKSKSKSQVSDIGAKSGSDVTRATTGSSIYSSTTTSAESMHLLAGESNANIVEEVGSDDEDENIKVAIESPNDTDVAVTTAGAAGTKSELNDEDIDWSGDEDEDKDDEKAALLDKSEDDQTGGKKGKKKEKKESKKARLLRLAKAENAAKIAAWEKEGEDNCFDLDQEVRFKPEDFEEEYLRVRVKHKDELEDVMGEELKPFEKIELFTGQVGGNKVFGNNRRQVGTIKGLWALSDESEHPFGNGLTALVQTRTMCVRVYILNAIHLISTDRDNSSDPYLVVKLGDTKFSTRSRYIKNTLEPKFHESFEFMSRLPGASKLKIEVWDWDGIGDDLVGSTTIDIEDRWFSKEWRKLKIKV